MRLVRCAAIAVAALGCASANSVAPSQEAPATPVKPARKEWRVEAIVGEAGVATAPESVPEELRKLLANDGLRVIGPNGKTRGEVWWRAKVPLAAKSIGGGFTLGRLVPGSFLGVLRAPVGTSDYRGQAIEAGSYGLRYFHQPSDGNHLGTSDSPDFLVLTSLTEEKSPDAVTSKEALLALAVPVSPSDHALVLYATTASEPPPTDGAARVVRRGNFDEWALECAISGQVDGAPVDGTLACETVRLAVVIEGHTAQ